LFLTVDLNADLGEGFGSSRDSDDDALLGIVSSANVACGFHAGDAATMRRTVRVARQRGVAIGAHPSYPDVPGFGRRELGLSPRQIEHHVRYQIDSLADICAAEGAALVYVKPHGALYNRAAWDPQAAKAIVGAIRAENSGLTLLGLPGSEMARAAEEGSVRYANEAFVDRAYTSDGRLAPRTDPGAVIHDAETAVARAMSMVTDGIVLANDGRELSIEAQSLCVHGDNPAAAAILRELRDRLIDAGVRIAPFAA
jgi:5-oxoprolinase (ATP-hydrolysing) subunit A